MQDVEHLKSRGDELAQRIAELEMLQNQQEETGTAVGEDAGANEAQVIPQQKLHAFDVVCDGRETDPWLIYLPSGCISYAGFTPDVIQPEPDATTHLADLQDDTKDGGIYAHLYLEVDEDSDSDSTSEPEVTGFPLLSIDTTPTQTPSEEGIKVVNIKIATIKDGAVAQNVIGSLMLQARSGSGTVIVGDKTGSEFLKTDGKTIYIQGYPESPELSHSGIEFWTVSARTGQGGEKIPPKIIARIIDKPENENWAAKTMKVTPKEGSAKEIHFLGSDDIEIDLSGGGGGGGGDTVVGSDYIEVVDEQDPTDPTKTNKAVKAKVSTPANQGAANNPNAVLTHNTDQFVRSKKTFLGVGQDNAQKKVVIDGPNGKVEVQNAAGNRIIKLDAADIPNECGQGGAATIQVRKLTVTHPREKDGKSADIYHVIGCADIDISEGDAIQSITSGTPTHSGGFTVTPVTITLKDGTALPAFNVSAKNGVDGDPGDDGASVTEATAGTPVVSGDKTTTPITFTLSDGSTVGPVNVVSTNGVSASGSEYIEVGDGTGGTTAGQVKAKVPANGSKGIITTDTVQIIAEHAVKTFRGVQPINLDAAGNTYTRFRFINGSAILGYIGSYDHIQSSNPLFTKMKASVVWGGGPYGDSQCLLVGTHDEYGTVAMLLAAPSDRTSTIVNIIPTMGWTNKYFLRRSLIKGSGAVTVTGNIPTDEGTGEVTIGVNVRNLVAGSGISLTQSGNNITITNTAQGGGGTTEGFTGTAPWLDGFKYDKTAHKLMYRFGSMRFENGLAVEYTPGGDDDFVDVPGGDAVEETV